MESITSGWLGWLLWLFGFDASQLDPNAKVSLAWDNLPSSWGVFVLIAALLAIGAFVVFLYIREMDSCPKRIRIALAGVRLAVLLVLLVLLLKPVIVIKKEQRRYPFVAVMRDSSQSMNTKDEYLDDEAAAIVAEATGQSNEQVRIDKPSRTELVNSLMAKNDHRFVRSLQKNAKVRFMDFADQVEKVGTLPAIVDDEMGLENKDETYNEESATEPGKVVRPLDPKGRGTNLWLAIKEAIAMNPLAAVVMFTDGQHTAGEDPVEIAEEALAKGVKLLIVGVGDPRRSRNVRVKEVYVREKVWPNEPFEVDVVLDTEGEDFNQTELKVELLEHQIAQGETEPGPGTVIQFENVTIPEGGGIVRVPFSHSVANAGRYKYTIKVESIQGEHKTDDNVAESGVIEAVEKEAKVLLIAGAPTWEYRMVQRLLRRDSTISVSCWLQTLDKERPQEGDEPIEKLPTTIQELGEYSVVMLFDPNPEEFDEAWIEVLKQFATKQSGGVLYMAGPKYSGEFLSGNQTGKLKEILPVRFGDVQLTEVQSLLATNRQSWPLRIVMENIDHPVMSFYEDPQKNLARWEELPGIYWSFPALGPKPTAKVLLEHSDPILRRVEGSRPLLVTGRYGPANTVYIGFNGTWRWRRVGRQAEFFDKYWIQVVRFLVETRTLQNQRRGYVEPERDEYEIGDKIVIFANLQDATYEPLKLSQVEGTLRNGNGDATPLTFRQVEGQPGQYETTLTAREEGNYALEIELAGSEGSGSTKVSSHFQVRMPGIETNQVWLNEQLLREVANKSGGMYYQINQLDKLSADIRATPEEIEVPGKPDILWGLHQIPYRLLCLLVILLSVEWAVRKGFKLL